MFGGLDANVFDGRLPDILAQADAGDFAAIFDDLPLFLLEIELSTDSFLRLRGGGSMQLTTYDQEPSERTDARELIAAAEELEGRWLEFALDDVGESARGILYRNLFGEPRAAAVSSASDPGAEALQALSQIDPLASEPDASRTAIETILASTVAAVDEVAIYDVGQGNANGLLSTARVAAYFDFGGRAAGNTATFPTALSSFCFCASTPPIILSHWDHDHWSSEGRDKRAHYATWIAPRQPIGGGTRAPHHSSLIVSIKKHGKLLIWPRGLSSLTVGQITIHQCTGTSRNASGLAVEVEPPIGVTGKPVLLPADAGYGDITGTPTRCFEGIACPHHGGRSNSKIIPAKRAPAHARLAYSYGTANTYHHPLSATFTAHDATGWTDLRIAGHSPPSYVRNTEDRSASNLGHIGLNWGSRSTPLVLPCSGVCNLGGQQY
jgi:hypothetical protein